ncbi:uncharacterized protein LOC133909959 [Phragmites australis]|uniref:uncharacterized protein LOC133909959 n=1 Tax=Phragmites australis TaxID=29695 RepID=UPI002D791132|nr:uncharacterized protein LOC133909959 [Phragmites australis]
MLYKSYKNELDYLQLGHVEWTPYQSQVVQAMDLNILCMRDSHLWLMRCPLICFYAVEYHLPHRVMRQFGRWQPCPPKPFSTSIDLYKMDRQKCKKITDWLHEHQHYINEFHHFEANNVIQPLEHDVEQFNWHLQLYHANYRVHLRPRWTQADMLEDESDDEANNEFDKRVREGTEVEGAPVADWVVRLTNRLNCTYILFVLTTLHISVNL